MRMRPPPPPPPPIGIGMGKESISSREEKEKKKKKRRMMPSPGELIAHYESKGMNQQEASVKVIQDLQNILFRVVSAENKKSKSPSMSEVEVVKSRLVRLEKKLDSKPGYPQTLAIGVASGALLQGIGHLSSAFAHIWDSVRSSSRP